MNRVFQYVIFTLAFFAFITNSYGQQSKTVHLKKPEVDAKYTPIDTAFIHENKRQILNIKNEASSKRLIHDTIPKPFGITSPTKTIIVREKSAIKETSDEFQQKYAPSKFNTLKIDTGDVTMEREGLKLRGKQLLSTNGLSDIPKAPHQKFDEKKLLHESISNTKQRLPSTSPEDSQVAKQGNVLLDKDAGQINHAKTQLHKVSVLKDQRGLEKGKADLLNVQKIYSEKYMKQIKDSLGMQKADSMFKVVSPLLKKEVSKEDLLQSINSSLPANAKANSLGIDPSSESLSNPDQSKMTGLSDKYGGGDVTKMKLPSEVLQELQPLGGKQVNGKYMHLVDSMRNINLKTDRLKLKENEATDNIKLAVIEKKQNLWDRSYGEGVLGILQNKKVTIAQFSPCLGFHLTDYFSIGAGPNFLITAEDKKLNAIVGLRCFSKVEFYQRRVYAQIEDNLNAAPVNTETFQRSKQTILVGGGVLLPLTRSVALNPSIMYKVNNGNNLNGTGSPWVFRLGISSIKAKK